MTRKSPTSPHKWQTDFAESLAQLEKQKDRATLAQLRRGRGKSFGQEARRDGWVLSQLRRLGRANFTDEWEVNRCCLIASLFAEHSASRGYGTLGAAFDRMAKQPGASMEAVERRFHLLLDSDSEDLPERLRYAITLLKSKEVPINWAQLLADITNWHWESRQVQKAWSQDFWAPRKGNDSDGSDGASAHVDAASSTSTTGG